MGVLKNSDHIQVKIKIPDPSQKPPASSNAPNQDLKGHVHSLHLQSQDRAKIWNMGVSTTSDHIKIKIKIPNQSIKPLVSSTAPNQDLKDMDFLYTSKRPEVYSCALFPQ